MKRFWIAARRTGPGETAWHLVADL